MAIGVGFAEQPRDGTLQSEQLTSGLARKAYSVLQRQRRVRSSSAALSNQMAWGFSSDSPKLYQPDPTHC